MRATIEFVERKFAEFNRLMFGGHLPTLPIELSDAKTFLGVCTSKVNRLPDGRKAHSDFRMRISTYRDLPESTLEDTIIHEMIHYFIDYNGLTDTGPHGEIFKSIMGSINRAHNRSISVRHHSQPDEKPELAPGAVGAWHVIAVIRFRSGKVGFKVLPRVANSVMAYYNGVRRNSDVSSVELYLHNAAYFSQYPTSKALKVYIVAPEILTANLKGARPITVNGNNLIV